MKMKKKRGNKRRGDDDGDDGVYRWDTKGVAKEEIKEDEDIWNEGTVAVA